MPAQTIDLQNLIDRAAIHDVLARYFQGLDRGDQDQVRSCFTTDVQAWYDGRPPARGVEEVMAAFLAFANQKSGDWKITTHFMGNLNFNSLEQDIAEIETNAIAFLVLPGKDTPETPAAEHVAMRSLRYLDRLRRTPVGWKICERMHTLDWSCDVPTDFATTTAQRLTARPPRMA